MTSESQKKTSKLSNLAKAREAKAKKNPPKYSQYCAYVVALEEEHPFSIKNVRQWIKSAREHKSAAQNAHRANAPGALAEREKWSSYVSQLESYLRTGSYISLFAGDNMEKRVQMYCSSLAYFPNGKPKRQIGVYYNDYRMVWTPELENEERESYQMEPLEFTEKGYIVVDRVKSPSNKTTKTKKKRKPMTEDQKKALVERLRLAREAKAKKNAK